MKPLKFNHSNESYWAILFVVLFIMLYKVALTFDAVDKILKCDHSHESYWAVLSCGAVCYGVQGSSNFQSVGKILKFDHSNENCWAVLSWYVVQFIVIVMYKVILIFESVNETEIWPFKWKSGIFAVYLKLKPGVCLHSNCAHLQWIAVAWFPFD